MRRMVQRKMFQHQHRSSLRRTTITHFLLFCHRITTRGLQYGDTPSAHNIADISLERRRLTQVLESGTLLCRSTSTDQRHPY